MGRLRGGIGSNGRRIGLSTDTCNCCVGERGEAAGEREGMGGGADVCIQSAASGSWHSHVGRRYEYANGTFTSYIHAPYIKTHHQADTQRQHGSFLALCASKGKVVHPWAHSRIDSSNGEVRSSLLVSQSGIHAGSAGRAMCCAMSV